MTERQPNRRHEQIEFELACLDYVQHLYNQSSVISTSHERLVKLHATYGERRVQKFAGKLIRYVDRVQSGRLPPRLWCYDWASQDNTPHLCIDPISLQAQGQLMPVDYELVANSPGIQSWSQRANFADDGSTDYGKSKGTVVQPDEAYMIENDIPSWFVWRNVPTCREDNPGAKEYIIYGEDDIEDYVYARDIGTGDA